MSTTAGPGYAFVSSRASRFWHLVALSGSATHEPALCGQQPGGSAWQVFAGTLTARQMPCPACAERYARQVREGEASR